MSGGGTGDGSDVEAGSESGVSDVECLPLRAYANSIGGGSAGRPEAAGLVASETGDTEVTGMMGDSDIWKRIGHRRRGCWKERTFLIEGNIGTSKVATKRRAITTITFLDT